MTHPNKIKQILASKNKRLWEKIQDLIFLCKFDHYFFFILLLAYHFPNPIIGIKMTRREPFEFIDFHSNDEPRKAFCRICEETTGRLNRLVPRYVNNILDDKFKVCSYCGELYAIYDVKFVSEYEPKTRLNENPFESGTQVSMINNSRVKRNKKTESSLNIYTILYNF